MADMLKRLMTVEVKETENRVLEIAGSTEDKDRMGDIIKASGWKLKPFKANPVFLWAHDYSQPPIGRATRVWVDKATQKLMFKVEFAGPEVYEFADTIYKLYVGGFLHATSVGFIPLDWEGKDEENPYPKWENNVYLSQELLELSAVPVPANANALVNARDQGLITVKEFEAVTHTDEPIVITSDEPKPDAALELAAEEARKAAVDAVHDAAELIKATTYNCECIDCGFKLKTEEHCKDVKCPECGGTMRRDERPGAGEEAPPKALSQEALADEIDFALQAIHEVGISEEQMPMAMELAEAIISRSTGDDIPDTILDRVGTVLSASNEESLREIHLRLDAIFGSQRTTEPGDKPEPLPEVDPIALQKERAIDVAEVTNLVMARLKGKRIN